MLLEVIRESAGRVGFVTWGFGIWGFGIWGFGIWGRAARQHRVSTLNVAVTRREYLPKDELRFCGMSNDASAGLKILTLEAIPIIT